jgi:hypothetical protein
MGGSTLRVRVHGEDALGVRPSLPCVIWRDKKAGFVGWTDAVGWRRIRHMTRQRFRR